jgi:hypothetical protein
VRYITKKTIKLYWTDPSTIPLTKGKCASVDPEDWGRLTDHRWKVSKKGTVRRNDYKLRKAISMAQEVMNLYNLDKDYNIYHKDGDKLNNKKENLIIRNKKEYLRELHSGKKYSDEVKLKMMFSQNRPDLLFKKSERMKENNPSKKGQWNESWKENHKIAQRKRRERERKNYIDRYK